ncbi:DUF1353 domain-containing protein [Actinophytocola sp. KF-1]
MTQSAQKAHPQKPGFAEGSEVRVHQVTDTNWETLSPLEYFTGACVLEVKAGQDTDFASVPRVFVWFLPRYGRYTKAAILHDYLCRGPVATGELPRADADRIFRQAMRELDVAFLRRWIMWAAVRLGALTTEQGRRGWFRSCWQVFPIVLVALLVVALPALVIVGALFLFYLVELVVWLVLVVNRHVRGGDAERVNVPSFLFWL